ncbi:MAG: type II toxin-antitoxin system VapC family toxin [Candidatus Competibacteraceae bacterium]|nr:MAG: type II toxin-antitoxin system VapC family toxin [Candidatus Competibacteraceae bacterium]
MSYLIDTNIVIYYFNGLTADEALHDLLRESFNISIITKIEFLGWSEFAANLALYSQAKLFIRHATLYGLTEEIAEQTIQLRQQFRTKTPDAIIAATALVNGLAVVTHNTDDFSRLGIKTRSVTMKS